MSGDKEWIYKPDSNVMISGRALHELCINKISSEYNIFKDQNEYHLDSGFNVVNFKPHDVTVYLYLLQLCSTGKFTITSGYDIGRYLKYPVRDTNGKKECAKASQSIARLRKAGYLVYLPSYHKGKMIPLVRIYQSKEYDQIDGFQYFCDIRERSKAFEKYGTKS